MLNESYVYSKTQNNPSPQVSSVQPTTQNVDKGHDAQTPPSIKGESNQQPSMNSQFRGRKER